MHDLKTIRQHLDRGDALAALAQVDRLLASAAGPIPDLQFLRAMAFVRTGATMQALQSLQAELFVNPDHVEAKAQLAKLLATVPHGHADPSQRQWGTALTQQMSQAVEFAAQRYTYRGVPLIKNCFDLAFYPKLLHQVRPATIIEIGTFYGGSASLVCRSLAIIRHRDEDHLDRCRSDAIVPRRTRAVFGRQRP